MLDQLFLLFITSSQKSTLSWAYSLILWYEWLIPYISQDWEEQFMLLNWDLINKLPKILLPNSIQELFKNILKDFSVSQIYHLIRTTKNSSSLKKLTCSYNNVC